VTLAAPMVVCNEEYRFVIAEQLRLLGRPGTMVLEPFGRNTAPALTLAALALCKNGADPVLLVMPADHVITQVTAFQRCGEPRCGSAGRRRRGGHLWHHARTHPRPVMATSRRAPFERAADAAAPHA
jgi:hypothetical protein